MKRRTVTLILTLILAIGALSVPVLAQTGRRNTAIGTSAWAIYEIARGNTGVGLLAAAGAVGAWNSYNRGRGDRRCRDAYMEGFRAGVRRCHREHARNRMPRRR